MIRAVEIRKSFDETEVLKGISMNFEKGKTNLIIGRSGAGKTVLLKLLVGLMEPTQGEVWYGNDNFSEMEKKQRRAIRMEVGMLFQGSALFDSMSVEDNVRFPLRMFSGLSEKEIELRAAACLERVELADAGARFPSECSGGMQKRVGIARAIAMNPKYLFCDEPNSGLDPQTAIVIDQLIKEITDEYQMTTVVISHDMNSVMEASDTIHFVHEGSILWNGDRHQLLRGGVEELESFVFASDLMRQIRQNQTKD